MKCPKCGHPEMVEIQLLTSFATTCPKCKDEGLNYVTSNPCAEKSTSSWEVYTPTRVTLPFLTKANESYTFRLPDTHHYKIEFVRFRSDGSSWYREGYKDDNIRLPAGYTIDLDALLKEEDKKPGVYWGEICDMP